MYPSTPVRRLGRSARFSLSARGASTEAAYRSLVRKARRKGGRGAFEAARSSWAHSHGLEPDDGAYLGELSSRGLTLAQLVEALAVCGQTRELVLSVVDRLVSRGFAEQRSPQELARTEPTVATANDELSAAQGELDFLRLESRACAAPDRRMIDSPLREAVFRVVAARRFVSTLSRRA